MEREQGACDESVSVRGVGLRVEGFRGGGGGCLFAGDGDAGPVGEGWFCGWRGREDEAAVGKIADAHVDAYDGAVFGFFFLTTAIFRVVIGSEF